MALEVLHNVPDKMLWKKSIKQVVIEHWKVELSTKTRGYSSPKYLSALGWTHRLPYNALAGVSMDQLDIRRVPTLVRVLTGTMTLQANRRQYNRTDSKTCLLCRTEPETRDHFIRTCPTLQESREPYEDKLNALLRDSGTTSKQENWTELILNLMYTNVCSHE